MEPREVEFWEMKELSMDLVPSSPLSEAAIFFKGTDLCALEVSCDSGRTPGSIWRLTILALAQPGEQHLPLFPCHVLPTVQIDYHSYLKPIHPSLLSLLDLEWCHYKHHGAPPNQGGKKLKE